MNTKTLVTSVRIFTVAYLENNFTYSNPCVKLTEIYENDDYESYEWKNAVQDNIDSVLDLRVGERLQMNFNRDNQQDSAGFIKRIK
jgi:hypothetical protein